MINEQNFNLTTTDRQLLYLILAELRQLNSNIMSHVNKSVIEGIGEEVSVLGIDVSKDKKTLSKSKSESRKSPISEKKEVKT